MAEKPLQLTTRLSAILGLLALTLTQELQPVIVYLAWIAWTLSWILDRYPQFQTRLRPLDAAAVVAMISVTLVDFFALRSTLFVCMAHFLLLFQIYKLIGRKEAKDCQQILFFAFFQVLSACTLAADIWQAGILLGLIPASALGLFWHQIAKEEENQKRAMEPKAFKSLRRLAWFLGLGALPVTLILTLCVFLFFPRLNWNMRIPGFGNDRIGYTEEVNLDKTGELRGGDTIVLWLSFASEDQRLAWKGYLRGASFDAFDGKQWKPSGAFARQTLRGDRNGILMITRPPSENRTEASITLLDVGARTLFTPGIAYQLRSPLSGVDPWSDGSLHFSAHWQRPISYTAWTTEQGAAFMTDAALARYLELPKMNERIRQLASQEAGTGNPELQALRLETYFKNSFSYSLNRGKQVSDPLSEFLFNRRQGPCGYFASAMAVMLRLQKIPSRVVAGYLGGEWNAIAGQFAVRQKDAHAWVEAYIPGKGWIRFDPTPRPRESDSTSNFWGRAWLGMRQRWDYMSLKWNRYIVEYDLYSQVRAFQSFQESSSSMEEWIHRWRSQGSEDPQSLSSTNRLPWRWIIMLIFLPIALLPIFFWKRPTTPADFYRRFLSQMARRGIEKRPSETGLEFAARASRALPPQASLIENITKHYYRDRFAMSEE